jgi:hypothetical protein
MIEERSDGKLEFEFNGKVTILDTRQTQDSIRVLVQMIVAMDERLRNLGR